MCVLTHLRLDCRRQCVRRAQRAMQTCEGKPGPTRHASAKIHQMRDQAGPVIDVALRHVECTSITRYAQGVCQPTETETTARDRAQECCAVAAEVQVMRTCEAKQKPEKVRSHHRAPQATRDMTFLGCINRPCNVAFLVFVWHVIHRRIQQGLLQLRATSANTAQ
jgi:hypothetical protein